MQFFEEDNDVKAGHGKKVNQKLKPYLVLQYMLRYSDEENPITAKTLTAYLITNCGIYAERRSIYKDIEDINKALLMVEHDITAHEATEMLEDESEKLVVYKPNKGFYVRQRHYALEDIRLLAECVYASKFIDEKRAKRLVNVACEFVSEKQARRIKHNAFVADRVKTENTNVYYIVGTINDAMSTLLDGEAHVPEKISFRYMKYSIIDMKQKPSRKGEAYIVSPYQLIINDGNYYLLCYEDKYKKMWTYRVDRMSEVKRTGQPREGAEEFEKIDLSTYTKRVFSMYSGDADHVTIRFINPLLDTVIDRFGTNGAVYSKVDASHFGVTAPVDVSDQFFGWLCGFGKGAKILAPASVAEKFEKYIAGIHEMYTAEKR